MSDKCDCKDCNRDEDHIELSTGKRYAFGQVVGLELGQVNGELVNKDNEYTTIYYGHDGYVGEGEGTLTIEEKAEIARLMIRRWTEFLKGLE